MMDDFRPTPAKSDGGSVAGAPSQQEQAPHVIAPTFDHAQALAPVSGENTFTPSFNTVSKTSSKKFLFGRFSKKQSLLIGVILLLILAGAAYALTRKRTPAPMQQAAVEQPAPAPAPVPTTEPSKLTGVEIPIELNKTPITAIMIENSPDARPQAGLKDAGVVIEMLVEGGISRFMAFFHDVHPDHVGPVRSLRPPYIDFVMAFDAAITHAGGSGEALSQVRTLGLKDIDHGPNASAFVRSPNRYAPHNLYTNVSTLIGLQNSRGQTSAFTPIVRKKDTPANPAPAKSIDITLSTFLYNSHWDYDGASNTYLRSQAAKPHTDERSGEQIRSKAVVALVMSHSYAGIYSVYGTTGSGKAYVFQDGAVTEATWHRPERKSQITLTDAAGAPLGLNAGNAWITLVSSPDRVVHKP